MRVGFVGLGTMGSPMALRLEEKGFDIVGWDLVPDARAKPARRASSFRR